MYRFTRMGKIRNVDVRKGNGSHKGIDFKRSSQIGNIQSMNDLLVNIRSKVKPWANQDTNY